MKRWETISLCVLVSKAQQSLATCLESVEQVVDEIIIVNTLAADVANKPLDGAKVIHLPGQTMQAAARLVQASGDWIFVLLADEYLEPEDKWKLRSYVQQQQVDALALQFIDPRVTQPSASIPLIRLFRQGRFHHLEQVLALEKRQPALAGMYQSDVRVYGHLCSEQQVTPDKELPLLSADQANAPADAFYSFNLGIAYMRIQAWEKARAIFALLRQTDKSSSFFHEVYCKEMVCLLQLQRAKEAANLGWTAIARYPDYLHAYHLTAQALLHGGRAAEAASLLVQALTIGSVTQYGCEEGADHCRTLNLLTEAYEVLGQFEAAIEAYVQAQHEQKTLLWPVQRLFRLLDCLGESVRIESYVVNRLKASDPQLYEQWAEVLLAMGLPEPAQAVGQLAACRLKPLRIASVQIDADPVQIGRAVLALADEQLAQLAADPNGQLQRDMLLKLRLHVPIGPALGQL